MCSAQSQVPVSMVFCIGLLFSFACCGHHSGRLHKPVTCLLKGRRVPLIQNFSKTTKGFVGKHQIHTLEWERCGGYYTHILHINYIMKVTRVGSGLIPDSSIFRNKSLLRVANGIGLCWVRLLFCVLCIVPIDLFHVLSLVFYRSHVLQAPSFHTIASGWGSALTPKSSSDIFRKAKLWLAISSINPRGGCVALQLWVYWECRSGFSLPPSSLFWPLS